MLPLNFFFLNVWFCVSFRLSYIRKAQYWRENVEGKKKKNHPGFQCETILHVRYIGVNWLLYHVHLQWIYQNSLDDCSARSGYYLACCNIPVPRCCGQCSWEKARWRSPKICSVIHYQLVRGSLDKLKISQMLFPS